MAQAARCRGRSSDAAAAHARDELVSHLLHCHSSNRLGRDARHLVYELKFELGTASSDEGFLVLWLEEFDAVGRDLASAPSPPVELRIVEPLDRPCCAC